MRFNETDTFNNLVFTIKRKYLTNNVVLNKTISTCNLRLRADNVKRELTLREVCLEDKGSLICIHFKEERFSNNPFYDS